MLDSLGNFMSHQNPYLILVIANLSVIIGLILFSKSAKENNFGWFLVSTALMLGGAIVIAFTLGESHSYFLNGVEIGFACLLVITLILLSRFGSTVECVGTVTDNTLKITYPVALREPKAIKVVCDESALKTRFVTFKKGAVLDAILATENPDEFQVGQKVRFRAMLREKSDLLLAPGIPYFETRTFGAYIRPLE